MLEIREFLQFLFLKPPLLSFFLRIVRLVLMFMNQQGQGGSHQRRWKMSKKHDALDCSTCSTEQLVRFRCLNPGMEMIWCYCRRLWRETMAQRTEPILKEHKF